MANLKDEAISNCGGNQTPALEEDLELIPALESFRQGWEEMMRGETRPIEEVWDGIDAE